MFLLSNPLYKIYNKKNMRTRKRCYNSVAKSKTSQKKKKIVSCSSSSSSSSSTSSSSAAPLLRIRVPRHLGNGSAGCGSSFSSSTPNGSPSSCSSTARSVPTDPNVIMRAVLGRILEHLRGHGLSANEITLFSRYLEQNPQIVSHAFLNMKGDQEKINFIRELDLTPYKDNPNPNQ